MREELLTGPGAGAAEVGLSRQLFSGPVACGDLVKFA